MVTKLPDSPGRDSVGPEHQVDPERPAVPERHTGPKREADEPVLPDVTRDERDPGWGDDPRDAQRDDEWYRRERPPHHG